MNTRDLDYELPASSIARFPLAERDASRVLCLERSTGAISHHLFRDLPTLLTPGDLLIRNVSRVISARLAARRASGGRVELLLVRDLGDARWSALARPAGRLRNGELLTLASGSIVEVRLEPEGAATHGGAPGMIVISGSDLAREIESSGLVPLPPYLEREPTPDDLIRYQTLWATVPGSVAAPTAGLHFSADIVEQLQRRTITFSDVVLHVGPGTFLPVRSQQLDQHSMHSEAFEVPESTARAITRAHASGTRVVAIGTTSVRAMESAEYSKDNQMLPTRGDTRLFIRPGFEFRATDALLTNFHQPGSTLLALVAAFTGLDAMRSAYATALRENYRFLSYGDAMLIL